MSSNKYITWDILIYAIILMIPAWYNGYPLVYSDSGTYIQSGMDLLVPNDRPVIYGLLIRLSSLGFSLWFTIFFQSILVSIIIKGLLDILLRKISDWSRYILLITLSGFSGLGWYTSQLMPDIFIFTAVGSVILLIKKQSSRFHVILWSLVLWLSISVHFSHAIIVFILSLAIWLSRLFRKERSDKRQLIIPFVIIISLLSTSLINKYLNDSFKINLGSHVFLMGKMLDSGVLKSFLDDRCSSGEYMLCQYKDQLPLNSRSLLWDPESPLYSMGGWQESQTEFNKTLFGIFTSPKHMALYGYNVVLSSITQLFQNDIGSGIDSEWYRSESSPPYQQVNKYFPQEFNMYIQSRQNGNLWKQGLSMDFFRLISNLLLFISILILLAWFSNNKWNKLESKVKQITIYFLISIVINAVITAGLANVYDRLQARISWTIIFMAGIIIINTLKVPSRQKSN